MQPGTRFRIGGLVKEGQCSAARTRPSASRSPTPSAVPVPYRGLLPDLFRDGQGVVAEGVLETAGEFRADSVLAKHDENYMPSEVADALKKQGVWQPDKGESATKTAAPKP